MHYVLIVFGVLAMIAGYGSGLVTSPASAPQQAVQELRFIHGALGGVMIGLGFLVLRAVRKP